jgi:plastocyanin
LSPIDLSQRLGISVVKAEVPRSFFQTTPWAKRPLKKSNVEKKEKISSIMRFIMRFRFAFHVVLLFWLSPLLCLADTVIEGRVTLPAARATPVVNKRYEIITKGGVVATNPPIAVVYLEGTFPKAEAQPVAQISQKELMFIPTLLPVRVGTKVEFPNLDVETYHNIFSYSGPKRFDLGRYRADEKPVPSQVFDVAGLVTLRCDIHEHMRGVILVLDTPYFVLSDTDGNFRLAGLPAGTFVLKAWINSTKTIEKPVEIKGESLLRVDFP